MKYYLQFEHFDSQENKYYILGDEFEIEKEIFDSIFLQFNLKSHIPLIDMAEQIPEFDPIYKKWIMNNVIGFWEKKKRSEIFITISENKRTDKNYINN